MRLEHSVSGHYTLVHVTILQEGRACFHWRFISRTVLHIFGLFIMLHTSRHQACRSQAVFCLYLLAVCSFKFSVSSILPFVFRRLSYTLLQIHITTLMLPFCDRGSYVRHDLYDSDGLFKRQDTESAGLQNHSAQSPTALPFREGGEDHHMGRTALMAEWRAWSFL